jgi:hypothetical protein
MLFVTVPLTILAIASLLYAWVLTHRELRAVDCKGRTETIALLSVFTVTMEILLVVVMFSFSFGIGIIAGDAIGWVTGVEVLFFLLALPCAIMRKGLARWCLVFSSIYFMAIGGMMYVASGIQF